jgi:hypothetical protein
MKTLCGNLYHIRDLIVGVYECNGQIYIRKESEVIMFIVSYQIPRVHIMTLHLTTCGMVSILTEYM